MRISLPLRQHAAPARALTFVLAVGTAASTASVSATALASESAASAASSCPATPTTASAVVSSEQVHAVRWGQALGDALHRTSLQVGSALVTNAPDGAVLVEYAAPGARVGIAIGPTPEESSWYYAIVGASGVRSASGALADLDLDELARDIG